LIFFFVISFIYKEKEMLFNFATYLFNIKNNNHYLNDYLNCYSNFILNNKTLSNKILLKSRMNLIVDYYYNSVNSIPNDKNSYIYYYLANFKDEFLNKPLITYTPSEIKNEEIDDGYYNDELRSHYKSIATIPKPEQEEDFTEIDEYYRNLELEEEMNKNKINDDIYNDDYYDDYNYDDYNDDIYNDDYNEDNDYNDDYYEYY